MIDHLDLNVSDLERSRAFYAPVLGWLGYTAFDEGDGWCSFLDPTGRTYIVLVRAAAAHASAGFHRKRIGVNHLAFALADEAAVDALHERLRGTDAHILYGAPMRMGDRYAVFAEDPDRLKLEFVYRPTSP